MFPVHCQFYRVLGHSMVDKASCTPTTTVWVSRLALIVRKRKKCDVAMDQSVLQASIWFLIVCEFYENAPTCSGHSSLILSTYLNMDTVDSRLSSVSIKFVTQLSSVFSAGSFLRTLIITLRTLTRSTCVMYMYEISYVRLKRIWRTLTRSTCEATYV